MLAIEHFERLVAVRTGGQLVKHRRFPLRGECSGSVRGVFGECSGRSAPGLRAMKLWPYPTTLPGVGAAMWIESTGIRTVMGSSGVNRPPRGRRLGRGRHFWTFTLVRGVVTL